MEWPPTPVFLPGESHGQRSLAGYIQSMGSQRVRHDLGTKQQQLFFKHLSSQLRSYVVWGCRKAVRVKAVGKRLPRLLTAIQAGSFSHMRESLQIRLLFSFLLCAKYYVECFYIFYVILFSQKLFQLNKLSVSYS